MSRLKTLSNRNTIDKKKAEDINPWHQHGKALWQDWVGGLKEVASLRTPFQELMAGITVAAVALPLNLALAVASGLPPSAGLLAGAIGGMLASVFGGASLQVTGPAAALNLMVLALAQQFGLSGVALAAILIGGIQIVLGVVRLGGPARFVPESVLAGFMTGVGLKLLDGQTPEFLGFDYRVGEIAAMIHRPDWLHEVSWNAVICALIVVVFTLSTSTFKRVPGSLVGIFVATAIAVFLKWDIKKVGVLNVTFDMFHAPNLSADQWGNFLVATIPLALLASVESLLASSTIDRITKTKKPHNPNLELLAQGVANIGSGLVGAMPVAGVVVRSTVNIQSGAKSRLSAFLHALILLLAAMHFTDTIKDIPLAALAGLLCVVGFRLIDYRTFIHLCHDSKLHALAFLLALAGTVSGYLMSGLVLSLAIGLLAEQLKKKSHQPKVDKNIVDSAIGPKKKTLGQKVKSAETQRPFHGHAHDDKEASWLEKIRERAHVATTAFIHGQASVIGKVFLGQDVHIAAGSSIRADEGAPFYIGDHSNIQDGVVIHALKERWIEVEGEDWAVYIGKNVSLAHQALIHGPSYIGDNSFVGFKAIVHDSILGEHCFVGHGAMVIGVEVPSNKFVPPGTVIDSLDKVDALPDVQDAHRHFNEDVVDVNRGLAKAYRVQEAPAEMVETKNVSNLTEDHLWKF